MLNAIKTLKLRKRVKRFASNSRGNVAMMTGLTAIPLIIAGGSAIDYERAINAKTELQASLDAAVLSAATSNSNDMQALTTDSRKYLEANYHGTKDATIKSYEITEGDTTGTLKATGVVSLNTWFMATVGIYSMDVKATSQAVHAGSGRSINLEVSLVLDNTGSMNTMDGSSPNTPIADLRIAAADFIDDVMPATQTTYFTKVAVIPYNNSVNMGSMANALAARGGYLTGTSTTPGYQNYKYSSASGGTVTRAITQCVTERTGSQAYTDANVSTYPVGRQYGANVNPCSVTPYLPLSTNATTVKNTINAMSAGNFTAGQVGIAWGWYTLSPTFGLFSGESVPAGYDKLTTTVPENRVKKVMILMSDGEYNSSYVNGVFSAQNSYYGNYGSDSLNLPPTNGDPYVQATAVCSAIKNSGIEVYTIAFQLNASYPKRVALMQNCASDAAHVLNASNSSQLKNVFKSLAQSLSTMRLLK
jgi:Flp pilus assembly protein TadG